VNEERRCEGDYGTEYLFWSVEDDGRLIPVRHAEGAELLEREDFDRLPPGVMSRVLVELERPAGTLFVLHIKRPKATRLPKRERRKFWLTFHGGLSRRAPGHRSSRPAAEGLPPDANAEMARSLLSRLQDPPSGPDKAPTTADPPPSGPPQPA
jgi:hypothetical protein